MTGPPPSVADLETMARLALAALPRRFRRELGALVIRVEEFPDEETMAAMRLASPFDLLGLYRGVALPWKSVSDPSPDFDMIFLYRRPILAYCAALGEEPAAVVRHVLIHEIGHHFGFSDADMHRIENDP
jgi:predicted Zn-dependent protease with MMP-like domain